MNMLEEAIERLRVAGRRLHEDRRGTSMTEFVITLPLFILLFEGIVVLGSLQREGTETKVKAAINLWNDSVKVQKSTIFNSWNDPGAIEHMHPFGGVTSTASNLGKLDPEWQVFEGAKAGRMATGGHYGESKFLVDDTQLSRITGHTPNTTSEYKWDATSHLNKPFATRQVNDGFADGEETSVSGGGGLGQLTSQFSLNFSAGVWQSQGAGIRYGSAWGEEVQNVNIPMYGNTRMEAAYSALVAPRSKGEWEEVISVAITRYGAEQEYPDALGVF